MEQDTKRNACHLQDTPGRQRWTLLQITATVGTERLNSHSVVLLEGYTALAKTQFRILNAYFCYAYPMSPTCPVPLPSLLLPAMSWSHQPLGKLTPQQYVDNFNWFWYNKGFCPFQKPSTFCSWCKPSLSISVPPIVTSDENKSQLLIAVLCMQSSSCLTSLCPGHLPWCYSPPVFCKPLAHSPFPIPSCSLSILLGYFILFSHRYASLTSPGW